MQQEDDLRALAKIMDFLRAVSILLVVMHLYWYCYGAILAWEVNIGVVDRILMNFDRTAGLFRSMLYTKLFALVLLALSCPLYGCCRHRICVPADGGDLDEPTVENESDGRCFQQRERELHAGDTFD